MTETHKIAKVLPNGPFAVAHKKEGWIDGAGKPVAVSASPKKTTFFSNEKDAAAAGFSPTDVQKAALAEWKTAAPPATK